MLRVGIADHFGWAIAVTATPDHRVVDRRRIELVEPGVCEAPIHYRSAALDDTAAAALVDEVRASVKRATRDALDELVVATGGPITSVSLRSWPADFPTEIAVLRRSPWEARADAVMYRQTLAEIVEERGWTLHTYEARTVEAEASTLLGGRAHEVLHGPRTTLGAPWAKDHRVALAATVLAARHP